MHYPYTQQSWTSIKDKSMDHHYKEIQFKHKQGQGPHIGPMGQRLPTHSTHMDHSIDPVNG